MTHTRVSCWIWAYCPPSSIGLYSMPGQPICPLVSPYCRLSKHELFSGWTGQCPQTNQNVKCTVVGNCPQSESWHYWSCSVTEEISNDLFVILAINLFRLFWGFPSVYAYTPWRRTTKFDVVTHIRGGLFGRGEASLIFQWGGVPALLNFWVPLYLCAHLTFVVEPPPLTWLHTWEWACFQGSGTSLSQGSEAPALPFFGSFLQSMRTHYDMITHIWRGLIFRGQPRLHFKRAGSCSAPLILGVLFAHPLTQNYEI